MHRDLNRFSCREYVAAVLLVSSAVAFALVDVKVSPSLSLIGIPLVLSSLVFNAVHSNTQEHVLQVYDASVQELMVRPNKIDDNSFSGNRIGLQFNYWKPPTLSLMNQVTVLLGIVREF